MMKSRNSKVSKSRTLSAAFRRIRNFLDSPNSIQRAKSNANGS